MTINFKLFGFAQFEDEKTKTLDIRLSEKGAQFFCFAYLNYCWGYRKSLIPIALVVLGSLKHANQSKAKCERDPSNYGSNNIFCDDDEYCYFTDILYDQVLNR